MPGESTAELETILPPSGDGRLHVTNVSQPTFEIFSAAGNSPRAAVLIFPGGGYELLSMEKEGTDVARWFQSLGISAFVLKYRVPKNREGALQDAQRALRLIRSRAKKWNIDATRVGVIGFSAGGHLAARMSSPSTQPSYAAVDSDDKTSCRPDFTILIYPAYLFTEGHHVAPEVKPGALLPPVFIVHSDDDLNHIPSSKVYAAALQAENLPHEFCHYATGGHGYGLCPTSDAKEWPQRAHDWLRNNHLLSEKP